MLQKSESATAIAIHINLFRDVNTVHSVFSMIMLLQSRDGQECALVIDVTSESR